MGIASRVSSALQVFIISHDIGNAIAIAMLLREFRLDLARKNTQTLGELDVEKGPQQNPRMASVCTLKVKF